MLEMVFYLGVGLASVLFIMGRSAPGSRFAGPGGGGGFHATVETALWGESTSSR